MHPSSLKYFIYNSFVLLCFFPCGLFILIFLLWMAKILLNNKVWNIARCNQNDTRCCATGRWNNQFANSGPKILLLIPITRFQTMLKSILFETDMTILTYVAWTPPVMEPCPKSVRHACQTHISCVFLRIYHISTYRVLAEWPRPCYIDVNHHYLLSLPTHNPIWNMKFSQIINATFI